MANEIMKLSSDKTVPSTTAVYTTYPSTKAAKDVLFDVSDDDSPTPSRGLGGAALDKGAGTTPRDPPPHTNLPGRSPHAWVREGSSP